MLQQEKESENSKRDYLDYVIILVIVILRHPRIILLFNVKIQYHFKTCNHLTIFNPFAITAVITSKTPQIINYIYFRFPNLLIKKIKTMKTYSLKLHKILYCDSSSLITLLVTSIRIRKLFNKVLVLLILIITVVILIPIHLHTLNNSNLGCRKEEDKEI